jgi:hypothetical protein
MGISSLTGFFAPQINVLALTEFLSILYFMAAVSCLIIDQMSKNHSREEAVDRQRVSGGHDSETDVVAPSDGFDSSRGDLGLPNSNTPGQLTFSTCNRKSGTYDEEVGDPA